VHRVCGNTCGWGSFIYKALLTLQINRAKPWQQAVFLLSCFEGVPSPLVIGTPSPHSSLHSILAPWFKFSRRILATEKLPNTALQPIPENSWHFWQQWHALQHTCLSHKTSLVFIVPPQLRQEFCSWETFAVFSLV